MCQNFTHQKGQTVHLVQYSNGAANMAKMCKTLHTKKGKQYIVQYSNGAANMAAQL